jgi:HEAT repeat protein
MVGLVNSLGVRRDAASVPELAGLIADPDESVAAAAMAALGLIGTALAAEALIQFQPKTTAPARPAWAAACLVCAEQLLAGGHQAAAEKIYRLLASDSKAAAHLRLAVEKGLARISR